MDVQSQIKSLSKQGVNGVGIAQILRRVPAMKLNEVIMAMIFAGYLVALRHTADGIPILYISNEPLPDDPTECIREHSTQNSGSIPYLIWN